MKLKVAHQCDAAAYLSDAKTCALYLNDALETSQAGEIAEALRDIRRANGSTVRSMTDDMHLAEVMQVLESAGIRLVALPRDASQA